jgi:hypothetical protein
MSVEAFRKMDAASDHGVSELPRVPALGFSMQVDLGAGRVCTLQTHIANDCSIGELNRMLDKMTHAGDRQRAHYQIEGLERDLHKYEKEQAQGQLDLQKIEDDFDLAQKARKAEIDRLGAVLANYQSAHEETQIARGVRDPSRQKSADKANAAKVENSRKDLQAEMQVAPEAHETSLREARKVMDHRAALIQRTLGEIEHNRKIVEDGLKG